MKPKKIVSFLIILPLSVVFLWQVIKFQKITFLETSNLSFIAAGILLIIGIFWYTLSSGVFDFFNYSLKKSAQALKRNTSDGEIEPLSKAVGKGYRSPLVAGAVLLIFSLITLFGYYL
ncbi:DUF3899 domain-containing protein [Carnobacterium sp.]|uniref:DUF3899 domain-containing protein n=1 Tax=Carnobacterium TaxID=2747 RepID=UPI002FCB12B5